MKIFSLLLILLFVVSCGKPEEEKKSKPAEPEDYQYELKQGECSTGIHSFSSMEKTCDALKNEEKNNFCARSEREKLFVNHNCEGDFS